MPGFFVVLSLGLHVVARAIADVAWGAAPPAVRTLPPRWIFAAAIACAVVTVNSIHGPGALAEGLLLRPPLHTGTGDRNQRDVEIALGLRQMTTPEATVALTRAGTIPYFADRPAVDILGKTDSHVARLPARMSSGLHRFVEFRPGHMKFDYPYSIGSGRPDVIVNVWTNVEEVRPLLRTEYQGVLVAGWCVYAWRGSRRVAWERVTAHDCGE
jgi:hypothetical protein